MKSKNAKPLNEWTCLQCKDTPRFEHKEMMRHLQNVHKIDPKKTKAKRSLLMHLGCDDSFSSQYEWEIDGLKFIQNTWNPRTEKERFY